MGGGGGSGSDGSHSHMNYSTSIIKEFICGGGENTIGTITGHNAGALPLSQPVKGAVGGRPAGESRPAASLTLRTATSTITHISPDIPELMCVIGGLFALSRLPWFVGVGGRGGEGG